MQGLKWARPCERPRSIPKSRPRGVRAIGLRYEASVARALPDAKRGQWFEFFDANGKGFCQTDLLLVLPDCAIVLECKLTETAQGRRQISVLYGPVVAMAYERPVRGIVVARALTRETEPSLVCASLEEAVLAAELGRIPTLHWLGKGPLH